MGMMRHMIVVHVQMFEYMGVSQVLHLTRPNLGSANIN
jgi:hypothetical protein